MAALTAWWLNLDAEIELSDPRGYRLEPRMRERIASLLPKLRTLLRPNSRLIGMDDLPLECRALAWCPTPSALTAIATAGLRVPAHPPLHVLQRVNHRSFCAALGQTLELSEQVDSLRRLRACVRQPSPTGDWVIKRPFGFAGRQRRRAIAGVLDRSTEGFAAAALARGETLQVEPWVQRRGDFSQHGWLRRDGTWRLAPPVMQRCDGQGRWLASAGPAANALDQAHRRALAHEAENVAEALLTAGYFGPFGIDAYLYCDARGRVQLNPRSEINARFTMGYQWPADVDPHEP